MFKSFANSSTGIFTISPIICTYSLNDNIPYSENYITLNVAKECKLVFGSHIKLLAETKFTNNETF